VELMQAERQERDWDELAELDPYWAILSRPGKRYGRWDRDEFFATGKAEAAALMSRAGELGHPRGHRRALDFGCGVGRVTSGLSTYFDECVGLDISENMVRAAKAANEHIIFVVNRPGTLAGLPDGDFDLVYSLYVLQHLPGRAAVEDHIGELCRLVGPGGLLAFQLPSHIPAVYRLQWQRRAYLALRRVGVGTQFLYNRLGLQPMAMSHLPEPAVRRLLEAAGLRVLAVDTEGLPGLATAGLRSSMYYATR
jgi:SAM-dependent methyltransferase